MLIQGTTDDIKLNWLADTIRTTQGKARYWRTAIIAKTQEECEALYAQLPDELKQQVQLILNESDFMKRSIILLPAFLAKGLELTEFSCGM